MIKSVTIVNHLGDTTKLELTRPEKSGFIVLDIGGLGQTKANVNMKTMANSDGGKLNSAFLASRNITMSLMFMEGVGYTIEELRLKSYDIFPSKKKIKLIIETDNRLSEVEGTVETNEPTIFSRTEGCSISILCEDSYLYSAGQVDKYSFSGVEAAFEFPFSNESLDEPMIEFGRIINVAERNVVYNGDAEIGITMRLHAIGDVQNIAIFNLYTRESMRIDTDKLKSLTGSYMIAGDEITICTVKRRKAVTLLRGGVEYNILSCLAKDSDWFELKKGDNVFAYTVESGANNLQFTIENQVIYGGT